MTERPPERPGGQDGPPDVRTAVHAVIVLLDDVRTHLATTRERDLLLRVIATRSALRRLRDHLDGDGP